MGPYPPLGSIGSGEFNDKYTLHRCPFDRLHLIERFRFSKHLDK
jgi:hypothetical protein